MLNVPQKVLDLVEIFDRNSDEYRAAEFNEANLRIQFVNPLFKTLGWDNARGYADVFHDSISATRPCAALIGDCPHG